MTDLFRKGAFAIGNAAAILVALYIAFARDLERPYWAMFTVFIVAQPLSGAVRSKAVYRLFGTFVGAAVALFLVPPLVQSPILLCLAMAAWVGICLYIALLDRTPRSYAFLLAGYTATIVGLSVVNTPEAIFDTTVSRLEEISLGIICGGLAHSLFFPRDVLAELSERIERALAKSREWLAGAILRPAAPADADAYARLSSVATELHILYTHVAFDTSDVPRAAPAMHGLIDRLALFLPAATNVQTAVSALAHDGSVPASTAVLLKSASDWLRNPTSSTRVAVIGELTAHRASALQNPESWATCLEATINTNLMTLIRVVEESDALKAAIQSPKIVLDSSLADDLALSPRSLLHRDRGLALLSACSAAAATLVASALWITTSWPEGAVAVQFAAIFCALFATYDRPAKVMAGAIVGILMALPIAALYVFAVLPQADGFVSLALVLSPILLLFSFMQTFEKLEGAALVMAIGFGGGLALQNAYQADFASFLNSNMAEIAGALIAVATISVFRTIDPAWNAIRIARAGWRDVSRLAQQPDAALRPWMTTMFDRIALVSSRMSAESQRAHGLDGLRDLRVGLNIAAIRGIETRSDHGAKEAFARVRTAVARDYDRRTRNRPSSGEVNIATAIDKALAIMAVDNQDNAIEGRAALSALRLDLASTIPGPALSTGAV
jgi:uncharacterized membrane protein YccC